MSLTTAEVGAWKSELDEMLDGVADAEARASLESLRSALSPYFDNPAYFQSILGKIQGKIVDMSVEEALAHGDFDSLEQIKALLPEDVAVTTI